MKKEQYVSPEFRFQELFLFEGVADVCWGFHHCDMTIFYDADHDDTYDQGETILFQHNFVPSESGSGEGCANVTNAIETAIPQIYQAFVNAGYERYWSEEVQNTILSHENAGNANSLYIPVHS